MTSEAVWLTRLNEMGTRRRWPLLVTGSEARCLEFHSCSPAVGLDRTAVAGHHLPAAKPAGNLSPGQPC